MVHWLVLRCDYVFQLSRHSEVVRSEREAAFVGWCFRELRGCRIVRFVACVALGWFVYFHVILGFFLSVLFISLLAEKYLYGCLVVAGCSPPRPAPLTKVD